MLGPFGGKKTYIPVKCQELFGERFCYHAIFFIWLC